MTGEEMYEASRDYAYTVGIGDGYWFPKWEDLESWVQDMWETDAYEQEMRDRERTDYA